MFPALAFPREFCADAALLKSLRARKKTEAGSDCSLPARGDVIPL